MLIFRRLPRALQPDSEAYPVTGSSHETRQPHMACSSKSQECRLDDSAVECSKTKGKERFSPDQGSDLRRRAARVDEGREVQTSTVELSDRALDVLSSLPRYDSLVLFTGTHAKKEH